MRRILPLALLLSVVAACTVTREPLPLPADFFAELDANGEEQDLRHAWLGLEVALNESDDLMSMDEVRPGVRVVAVEPDSPAAKAGIQVGDILLEMDGAPVNDPGRLTNLLANIDAERSVRFQVERRSRVFETLALPEIRSSRAGRTLGYVERALLRVAVKNGAAIEADPQGRYPEIAGLGPESPLAEAGARVGDRILTFQGADPGSASAFVRRIGMELAPGDGVRIEVAGADGKRRALEFEAWSPGSVLTEFGLWPLFRWRREADGARGTFWLGDLLLVQVFRVDRIGAEKKYSILGVFSWGTGEAVLQEETVAEVTLGGVGAP